MRTRLATLTGACTLTMALAACGNGSSTTSGGTLPPSPTSVSTSHSDAASSHPSGSSSGVASSSTAPSSGSAMSSPASSAPTTTPSATAPGHAAPSTPSTHATQGAPTATSMPSAPGSTAPTQAPARTAAPHASGTSDAPRATSKPTSGPVTGGVTYTATGWTQFASPSGQNWCNAQGATLGCLMPRGEWAKHGDKNNVTLTPRGVGFLVGDAGLDTDGETRTWTKSVPGAHVPVEDGRATLPYGSSIRYRDVTCTSTRNGFTCRNAVASFTVNAQGVTISGKRA